MNACQRFWADDVSALSEARVQEKVHGSTVLRRAFDKAVRRKPPAVAADAGPMQIQWWEGSVPSCAGAVRESKAAGTEREKSDVGAKFSRRDSSRKWKGAV
jgi:hypothetical protein